MQKLNITNPYIFWSFLIIFIFIFSNFYNFIKVDEKPTKNEQTFEKYSYETNKKLDTYEFPNINVKLEPENKTFYSQWFSKDNSLLVFFLLIYSVGLSMLFTYRERSRLSKETLDEKIKIEKERMQSKVNIFEDIEHELKRYENIITPELKLNDLDKKINTDTNYVIINSRVVLEKVLLQICNKYNLDEETLNKVIYALFKKELLNHQTKSYAHTIKAFGNRAAHPNIKNPIVFTSKDALLVLSSLISLLSVLESQNLLEGLNNA